MVYPTLSQDEHGTQLALVPSNPTEIRYSREDLDLLKTTIAKDLTDQEFAFLVAVSKRRGLDLFAKQLYGIKRREKRDDPSSAKMVLQTGIDGYRKLAADSHVYAGSDDAQFSGQPKSADFKATVTVYRITAGQRCPFTASARWPEYYSSFGGFWDRMPFTMLGKVAEALALRKGFPEELSGIYTDDEMMQADNAPVAHPAPTARSQPRERRVVEEKPAAPAKVRKWATLAAQARAAGIYETQEQWEAFVRRIVEPTLDEWASFNPKSNAQFDAVEKAIADKEAENRAAAEGASEGASEEAGEDGYDLHDLNVPGARH